MKIEILSVRKYKAGYEIRTEMWSHGEGDERTKMKAAYTPDGEYIGDSKWAHRLIVKRGIKPEKSSLEHSVCSIGFCAKEQKWYGWSHRAICGFGIGDKIFEEEFGDDTTLFVDHGLVTIENMEQAKLAAVRFAEYVS